MKKLFSLLFACLFLCLMAGCDSPDALKMDLYQGYGDQIKLIHLNASSEENRERMDAFAQALVNAEPLEKDLSMFAYYPDYKLELSGKRLTVNGNDFALEDVSGRDGVSLTAIVDLNGDFVDFCFPGPAPEQSGTIYRSAMPAEEFKKLVHQA